jgi:16S rRNA processing protein RimM
MLVSGWRSSRLEAADRLRGASIAVPRGELPDPEQGEYYLADLVGAQVRTPEAHLGEVVEVRVYASVDALVIRTSQGQLVEQPLAEPWIQSVDAASGVVHLTSDEGLVR